MEECVKIWIKMLLAMMAGIVLALFLPADKAAMKDVFLLLSKISLKKSQASSVVSATEHKFYFYQ